MNFLHSKPFYLIDRQDPTVLAYKDSIETAIRSDVSAYNIAVDPVTVRIMDIEEPERLLSALQHYPKHIEQMLYTMKFNFRVQTDGEAFIPESEWKANRKYHTWFHKMNSIPYLPFFVNDFDVRLYMLAGDYTALKSMSIQKVEDGPAAGKIRATGGGHRILSKRLFESCVTFMLYCHGSGFDSKDAIKTLLADFTLPVQYADIYKQYQKDLKNSFGFWAKPNEGNETKAA